MRWAQIAVVTVLSAGSAAWADKVVMADQTYDNVKVVDYSAGALQTFDSKGVHKIPLADVKQLTLNNEPMFDQAEELRAQGKFSDALALYTQARAKAMKGSWHQMLTKTRLDEMKKLGGQAPGKTASGGNNPPEEKKAPPLSSLDALGDDLATEPMAPKDRENWKGLEEQERKEATAKYDAELAAWKKKHSYKGAKVSWVMTVEKIETDSEGGRTLVCKSSKGFIFSTEPVTLDEAVQKVIDAHKPVAIVGTIKEYSTQLNRSDSVFNTDMEQMGVVLSDVQVYLPSKAPKLAATTPASQPASAPAGK
jgi:hypothetical protein